MFFNGEWWSSTSRSMRRKPSCHDLVVVLLHYPSPCENSFWVAWSERGAWRMEKGHIFTFQWSSLLHWYCSKHTSSITGTFDASPAAGPLHTFRNRHFIHPLPRGQFKSAQRTYALLALQLVWLPALAGDGFSTFCEGESLWRQGGFTAPAWCVCYLQGLCSSRTG